MRVLKNKTVESSSLILFFFTFNGNLNKGWIQNQKNYFLTRFFSRCFSQELLKDFYNTLGQYDSYSDTNDGEAHITFNCFLK